MPSLRFIANTTSHLNKQVFPLTAAASIYVAVVHLFHALAATEAFGTGGVVVQAFMMVLGLCVHSLLGY